jgi:hypothetical protein
MKSILLLFVALLAGCANLQVQYQSDPPGATLYQDGQPIGMTPYTLTYQATEAFKNGGCMQIRPTEVKWASGASATTGGPLQACSASGYHQGYVFIRPDIPGRDVDVNFAMQLQRNQIMKQQNAIMLQRLLAPPKPVNCTTTYSYGVANTSCW